MKFGSTTPIFRIFDEEKAREFYIDYLEFTIDWEHRFSDNAPLYMQVSKGGCIFHLSEHHGDCTPVSAARIETPELKKYHAHLSAKNYKYYNPGIEKQPWGCYEMIIMDPFGNRLIFFKNV